MRYNERERVCVACALSEAERFLLECSESWECRSEGPDLNSVFLIVGLFPLAVWERPRHSAAFLLLLLAFDKHTHIRYAELQQR